MTMVEIENGKSLTMSELQVGEKVKTGMTIQIVNDMVMKSKRGKRIIEILLAIQHYTKYYAFMLSKHNCLKNVIQLKKY